VGRFLPLSEMPWTSKLKAPIALAHARALILGLPEFQRRRPQWEYAANLVMDAAQGGKPRRAQSSGPNIVC
jgi:hypothetical protein